MTYVPGNTVTGFTVELDGDPDALARVLRAMNRAIAHEIEVATRAQTDLIGGRSLQHYIVAPNWPFRGELQLRTVE